MAFKKSDNPRTEGVLLRLTPDEKAQLTARANDCAMPVTEYLRARAFAGRTRNRSDVDAINLLREIADNLKDLHRSAGTKHGDQLQAALDQTVAAIQRVWASGANR
ncbi:hypothetical protein R77560_04803 [Ralstonia thomasii]|uniref:Mobilization protein MobB n=1 Tax=Ralstonia thomasii TaxID=3058596 RepID=A0AAD2BUY2_9RALS|nr:hypothetical protein [Ralstonia sp. LMG 18095]CAJ0808856.1 hypothetical protein R77560_04803 [Ralstonia sp. LMG 18095]